MFWRKKKNFKQDEHDQQSLDARAALSKSQEDYEWLQGLKPEVQETINKHLVLQRENHFAERMWFAYRGEFLR